MGLQELLISVKKSLRNVSVAGLVALPLIFGACQSSSSDGGSNQNSSSGGSGGGGSGGGSGGTSVPYHVLTSGELSQLSPVTDSSVLQFSQPMNSFSVGNILAAGKNPQTPKGLLRRITSKLPDGRTFYTVQSTLEEALNSTSFMYDQTLNPSGATYGLNQELSENHVLAANFNIPISATLASQFTASGNLALGSEFLFDMNFYNHRLTRIAFQNISYEELNLNVQALASLGNISETRTLRTYNFPTIEFWTPTTPSLPIVIEPEIEIIAAATGNVSPTTANFSQRSSVSVGALYNNGSWSFLNDSSSSVTGSATLSSVSNLKVSVGPRLKLKFYGLAGMFGDANGFFQFSQPTSSTWRADVGLNANVGIDMGVFSDYVQDYSVNAFDQSWPVANGTFSSGGGGSLVQLTSGGSGSYTPDWSPDGMTMIYSNLYSILAMNSSDGSNKRTIFPSSGVYTPRFSHGGNQIAFWDGVGRGLSVVSLVGSTWTNKRQLTYSSGDDSPSWPPNDSKIAFINYSNHGVWVMNSSDGSGKTPLHSPPSGSGVDHEPVWTPDGTRIFFSSDSLGGIYSMDSSSGSGLVRILGNANNPYRISVSPDGTKFLFSCYDSANQQFDLCTLNSSGIGIISNLTPNTTSSDEYDGAFSPDGRQIVFVSDRSGTPQIYKMSYTP